MTCRTILLGRPTWTALSFAVLAMAGCSGNSTPQQKPPSPRATAQPAPPPDQSWREIELPPQPEVLADTTPPPPARDPRAVRFLVLTPKAPLIFDSLIDVDGQDLYASAAALYQELFQQESIGWDEFFATEAIANGTYGGMVPESDDQQTRLRQQLDTDADGQVDIDELFRWLTQSSGGRTVFAVSVDSRNRGDNKTRSAVRELLDTNRDGALDREEIKQAARRLRMQDADGNDILRFDELQAEPQEGRGVRRFGAAVAVDLNRVFNWSRVLNLLQDNYTFSGELERDAWSEPPRWFDQCDLNADNLLTIDELPQLAEVAPDFVVHARFDAESNQLQIVTEPDHCRQLGSERLEAISASRHQRSLGDFSLRMFSSDQLGNSDGQAPDELPDQALFDQFDADDNGYLELEELGDNENALGAPFDRLDTDQDGKLYPRELRSFRQRQLRAQRNQVVAMIRDEPDALFCALDVNHDDRLTSRELDGVANRLQALDSNQDGRLWPQEIPGAMSVAWARGTNLQATNNFPQPNRQLDVDQELPEWFRMMDANTDGEVSRREFLGTSEQFSELDSNTDGYVDGSEWRAHAEPQACPQSLHP